MAYHLAEGGQHAHAVHEKQGADDVAAWQNAEHEQTQAERMNAFKGEHLFRGGIK